MQKIEIVEIDEKRWAWLHFPLGVGLGVAFVVWYFIQEGSPDTEMLLEGLVAIVIGIPCIVVMVMGAALLQAALLNGFLRRRNMRPIITVRILEGQASHDSPP